ncbi:hypothetical protein BGX38DRAFT_101846 [Terfezia claveryi]|nr:hypothetical protein BGX38DRAFT_101846 [Terfezia claveryi]
MNGYIHTNFSSIPRTTQRGLLLRSIIHIHHTHHRATVLSTKDEISLDSESMILGIIYDLLELLEAYVGLERLARFVALVGLARFVALEINGRWGSCDVGDRSLNFVVFVYDDVGLPMTKERNCNCNCNCARKCTRELQLRVWIAIAIAITSLANQSVRHVAKALRNCNFHNCN